MIFNRLRKYKRFIVLIFLLLFSFMTACGAKDTLDNNVPYVSQNEPLEGKAESTNEEEKNGEAMEMAQNQFAVYDIDQDGKDELIQLLPWWVW